MLYASGARSQRGAPFWRRSSNLAWVIHRDSIMTMVSTFVKDLFDKVGEAWKMRTSQSALIALAVGFAAAIGTDAFHIAQGPQDGATRLENWLLSR
jgi:hypothetical protein